MAASETLRTFRLQLTTITPVSIGDDEAKTLSPYADYVFSEDGGSVFYLDNNVLQRGFEHHPEVIEEYVRSVWDGMDNTRSNFDLRNFVEQKLKMPLTGEIIRKKVEVDGLEANLKQQIRPIAKSAGDVYIPGSSIKGAIRTAILYDWLVETKEGDKAVKYLEKDLQKVAAIRRRSPNPRRMDFNDRKDLRRLERNFFPEDKLFGTVRSPKGPDARRIRVSDTNTTELGLAVMALKRIRLTPNPRGGGKSEIPIPREVYSHDQPLEFTISILSGFDSAVLKYWEEKTPEEILTILHKFTLDALANEIYELENAPGGDFQEEVEDLLNFYHTLRNRAEGGEFFFRLGYGKTIYDNSLALAMLNGISDEEAALEAFHTFRQSFWRMNRHAQVYPATRTITPDGKPMGWVKIRVVQ